MTCSCAYLALSPSACTWHPHRVSMGTCSRSKLCFAYQRNKLTEIYRAHHSPGESQAPSCWHRIANSSLLWSGHQALSTQRESSVMEGFPEHPKQFPVSSELLSQESLSREWGPHSDDLEAAQERNENGIKLNNGWYIKLYDRKMWVLCSSHTGDK